MSDTLEMAFLILNRCRLEGAEDRRAGLPRTANPYPVEGREIEYAGWLDGWMKGPLT